MNPRTWLIGLASVTFIFALCVLYLVRAVWVTNTEIDAWSQAKYSPTPTSAAELPIEIVGQQFEWRVRYPSCRRLQTERQLVNNFAKESSAGQGQADDVEILNELHLWKGGSATIYLKSADVPHSFFVPQLRLKQDAIPGKVTDVSLEAIQSNVIWDADAAEWKLGEEWEFACAEHSGQGTTKMRGRLFVHETKVDFLNWLKRAGEMRVQPGPK